MEMILTGIENKNEYYTNHYFTSIFQDNAEDTIKKWKQKEKQEEIQLPWKKLRDVRTQYYNIRDRYLRSKNEEASKPMIQELATLYLKALGYESINSVSEEVADGLNVPIFHEVTKANGAPLLWAFLSVVVERDDDILQGYIFEKSDDEDENGASVDVVNDDILAKLFFAGEEAPRFILLFGINQIALIDRNKWNEKRYLQFMMEDIYSRHEESTFMAMTVLLHKESLCPADGTIVLDSLDENSHKHSAGVSDALKYALRESIEILGNEVIYDMKTRQKINLEENPVDASELTLECLRYMYRFLFMLFIEARPELGYAPMKSQTYVQGYSLEGLRDVCDQVKEDSEVLSEGYYIDDTLKKLFHMTYFGYPENLEEYKKAIEIEKTSMHDAFTIEALKAHIFDPEYTKLITKARLRNCAMLQIVDLMSISRPRNSKERKGRISYSALGINQMGAVYEALLSYRGFIAKEDLYEVKRAGDKFNELDVGYFVKENELENYDEKTERVRYESGEKKGQLRMYEKGTFIYRLAGREREKSASYYTPEVLTKCLVKYALKELLKDKTADEILHLTVCEPAMGSAAFLNEAINQLAEAYLTKKQEELGETISYDKRFEELQKVKMFIADRNVYGCDLNPVAVELAEVSLWLNTIYKGAYVPWFGTQLVNGNSLIGARRQVYSQAALESGKWYEKAPRRIMPNEARTRDRQQKRTKEVYHFLLVGNTLSDINSQFMIMEMWHETNSQKSGYINRKVHFSSNPYERIYSGPHIGVCNPLFKTSRRECKLNSDYDNIDLLNIEFGYSQRTNYVPGKPHDEYMNAIVDNEWSGKVTNDYRIVARKMLNLGGERTFISAVIPPKTTHINGLLGFDFKNKHVLVLAEAMFSSIPFDYFVRTLNKSNLQPNVVAKLPYVSTKYDDALRIRALMLNCLSSEYEELWEAEYKKEFNKDSWAKRDNRLDNKKFRMLQSQLSFDTGCRTDFARREMLIELDVLTAMALGMTLEQLKTIYTIQFPVLQSYEDDTWYDTNGRIVFTNNRSMVGVGLSRPEFESIKDKQTGTYSQTIIDDTTSDGSIERTIDYVAPFDKCDRVKDYEEIWNSFEERFVGSNS